MAKNILGRFTDAASNLKEKLTTPKNQSPTGVAAFFPEEDIKALTENLFTLTEQFSTPKEDDQKAIIDVVKQLLKQGANPYIKDNKQKSVFDYAKDANNLELMHLIYQNSEPPKEEAKIITETLEQATILILESDNAPDLEKFLDQTPYLGNKASSYLANKSIEFALNNHKKDRNILDKVINLVNEQNPQNDEFKKALAAKLVEYSNKGADILGAQILDQIITSLDKEPKDYKFGKLLKEFKYPAEFNEVLANFSINSSDKEDVTEGTISKKDLISLHNSAQFLQDKSPPEGIRSQIDENIVQATNKFLDKQVEAGNLAEIIEISKLAKQNKAYMFSRIGDYETLNKATFNLELAQEEYDVEQIEIDKALAVMLEKPSKELETQLKSSLSSISSFKIADGLITIATQTEDKEKQRIIATSLSQLKDLKKHLNLYAKDELEGIINNTDASNHHLLNVVMQNKDPKINLGQKAYLKLTESASANNNSELLAAILKETAKYNQIDAVINANTLPPKTLSEATNIIINDEHLKEEAKLKIAQAALTKINIYPELLNPLLEKAFNDFEDSQQTLADAVLKDPSTIKNLNQENIVSLAMHYNPNYGHSPEFLRKCIDNEILDRQGKLKTYNDQNITSYFNEKIRDSITSHVKEYITKKERHEKKPILTWIDAIRDAKKLISPWNKAALEEYKNKQLEEPITKMQEAIKEKLPKPKVTPKILTEEEMDQLLQQQETHKKIDAETKAKIAAAEKNASSSRQKRSKSLINTAIEFGNALGPVGTQKQESIRDRRGSAPQ